MIKTLKPNLWKLSFALLILAVASLIAGAAWQPLSARDRHGFDRAELDTTCKPCQGFFRFATGGWTARNPIQPAYSTWGRFNALQDKDQTVLRQILDESGRAKNAPDSLPQKIGDFYASCMDTDRIEAAGIAPIQTELDRVAKIQTVAQLQEEIAHFQSEFAGGAMFQFSSAQDDKDSSQIIAIAEQGGLGLPDRDYYTRSEDRSKTLREEYEKHVARMFQLAGDAPDLAAIEARTVIAVETQMAMNSKTRVQRRDPLTNYHKLDLAQLRALTPGFSWETYFRNVGYPAVDTVNVGQPEFFQALDKQMTAMPIADWRVYMRWHVLHAAAPSLSSKFVDENFAFFGRTLTGAKELQPRWKRCVISSDRNLGELVGQIYVARAFPPEAKARAKAMVENMVAALRADIQTLPWMTEPTRKEALAKLASMDLKIGYPDKWRDYSDYHVVRDSYIENLQRGRRFAFRRQMNKIGKPVDRTEWGMTPPTVNAYYDPEMNEIVFPAGILQPPFFDAKADDAYNYGGIGAVIGHEMTHGFDDQGSRYDAKGNLRDWWTPEDRKNFEARADCIEKQFDSFVVLDDVHENGKLVLGESIADLGGLTIAHMAYQHSVESKAPKKIDGFTPEQRFFLGFARIWGTTARPEYERNLTITDPHPLPRFRADGALQNLPEFAAAFDCKAGDPMVRPANERCRIW